MGTNGQIHTKFAEHYNAAWVLEDCEVVASPQGIAGLFQRLVANKEISILPHQAINLRGPTLSEFERDTITVEEQDHLINALLGCQKNLARIISSLSPFSQCLQKRLVVLQRIYHGVSCKHHSRQFLSAPSPLGSPSSAKSDEERKTTSTSASQGNNALFELGVKTGLNMLFLILRQNWALAGKVETITCVKINVSFFVGKSLQTKSTINSKVDVLYALIYR